MGFDLLVDIGNTNISWQIGDNYSSIAVADFSADLIPEHQACLVSCVANFHLVEAFNKVQLVTPKPYKNLNFDYDLNQLGVDRFLAIIAAYSQFPTQDLMLIDIGTFVTIDYIHNNQHTSGSIAPGLELLENTYHFSGDDSQKAWISGTKNLLTSYLKQSVVDFRGKILITGGGQNIVKFDKASYHQNLVIQGLAIINEQQ